MKRTVTGAIACLAVLGLGAAPARAKDETTITAKAIGGGYGLGVTAAMGKANDMSIQFGIDDQYGVVVRDAAGITVSPDSAFCDQVSQTQVNCTTRGLRRVSMFTGDLNDVVRLTGNWYGAGVDTLRVAIDAGRGDDMLTYDLDVAPNGDLHVTIDAGSGDDVLSFDIDVAPNGDLHMAIDAGSGDDVLSFDIDTAPNGDLHMAIKTGNGKVPVDSPPT